MLYQNLLARLAGVDVTFSAVGIGGEYGRSLLSQVRTCPSLVPQVLCDLNREGLADYLFRIGYRRDQVEVVDDIAGASRALGAGRVAVTDDPQVAVGAESQVLLEATGAPEVGIEVAYQAIERGSHIVMINKEADSVAGISLARRARARGLNYVFAHGDQPRNLIELVAWSRVLGLEVVAAGKSSEYDFVYDPASRSVSCVDLTVDADGMDALWHLGADVPVTVDARSRFLAGLPQATPPDYGEMSLVANATGMPPSRPEFHYPLARITELADIYSLREDGGLVEEPGVLDVFNLLRGKDEPSFAGGVFVVVKVVDPGVWEVLRGKGHVVSANGRYACVYHPYHFMGVETPVSILAAALDGPELHPLTPTRRETVVVAETTRAFSAGEVLDVGGPHNTIEGTRALIYGVDQVRASELPYYLAGHHRLATDVPAGTVITEEMVEIPNERLVRLWKEAATVA